MCPSHPYRKWVTLSTSRKRRYRTNSRWGPVYRQLARQTQFCLRNIGVHLLPPLQGPADTAVWKSRFLLATTLLHLFPVVSQRCMWWLWTPQVLASAPRFPAVKQLDVGWGVSSALSPLRSWGERIFRMLRERAHTEMMSNLFSRACCLGEMQCVLKLFAQHHPCCLDLWVVYSVTSLPPPIPFKKWNSWATVGVFLKSWLSYEVGMQIWPASSTDFSCQSTAELKHSFFICNCRKQGT